MKISDIINFTIHSDYVDVGGQKVYFFRISPPNLNIMTDGEKGNEILKFERFFESLADIRFQLISLDKTENLAGNKAYWSSLVKPDVPDPCKEIKQTIIRQIDSMESASSSVGRAFYFVLKVKDPNDLDRFRTELTASSIPFKVADRQESVTVLRNYILREFVSFDIFDLESEVMAAYESAHSPKSTR